jgi:hypothetical protein
MNLTVRSLIMHRKHGGKIKQRLCENITGMDVSAMDVSLLLQKVHYVEGHYINRTTVCIILIKGDIVD